LIIQGARAITDTHEAGGDARLPPLNWEIRCLQLSLIVGWWSPRSLQNGWCQSLRTKQWVSPFRDGQGRASGSSGNGSTWENSLRGGGVP